MSKEEWVRRIDIHFSDFPKNISNLFLELKDVERFQFQYCPDSVLQHTLRMYELHKNHFELNIVDYFKRHAILLHDLEEVFTGDIVSFSKTQIDKNNEAFILKYLYKKTLETRNPILIENINDLLNISTGDECKTHIKVLDTFDGLMFSFHMVSKINRVTYLAPLMYYLNPSFDKSFMKYLKEIDNTKYSFFKKTKRNSLFNKSSKLNGFEAYQEINNLISLESFTQEDIESILKFEKELIEKNYTLNAQKNTEGVMYQLFKSKCNISDFELKLKNLIKIMNQKSHYEQWLEINTKVLNKEKQILEEVEKEFKVLQTQQILQN